MAVQISLEPTPLKQSNTRSIAMHAATQPDELPHARLCDRCALILSLFRLWKPPSLITRSCPWHNIWNKEDKFAP